MFGLFPHHHRDDLRATPLPEAWIAILARNVPLYDRLPADDKAELHGHIQVFLAEKTFEGCGGLAMTDEIRVTIAGQACLLLLHRETDYFAKLISILVYPSTDIAPDAQLIGGRVVLAGEHSWFGEPRAAGVVALSWDDVQRGAYDPRDGHNVVFHDFARQLDLEDGAADGAPLLKNHGRYAAWSRILGHDFDQLRDDQKAGRKTVLDAYGATNPAEFFAVASECFFEKPAKLKKKHPELYDQLRAYYHLDPEATFAARP